MHPSELLPKKLTDEIRALAPDAEVLRSLHPTQLHIIYEQNWFNMYVPKAYGGLELSLPEILRIEEALSWTDGSTAWVVTLCSGAAWFIGFLDLNVIKDFFGKEQVCLAGSGAVTGIANQTSRGFEINGLWKYATGSLIATAFTVNCLVQENGKQLYNLDKTPKILPFLLKAAEVIVHKTWASMGMVATGSHSIEVKQVQVPLNRMFVIDPAHATLPQYIFKYPFLQLAELTLAVNIAGLACRFHDLCGDLFSRKGSDNVSGQAIQKLSNSQAKLQAHRKNFYAQSDGAWRVLISAGKIPENVLLQLTQVSQALVKCSRECVNEVYPLCGLAAADTRTELNRVWRNVHTAAQHSLFKN